MALFSIHTGRRYNSFVIGYPLVQLLPGKAARMSFVYRLNGR